MVFENTMSFIRVEFALILIIFVLSLGSGSKGKSQKRLRVILLCSKNNTRVKNLTNKGSVDVDKDIEHEIEIEPFDSSIDHDSVDVKLEKSHPKEHENETSSITIVSNETVETFIASQSQQSSQQNQQANCLSTNLTAARSENKVKLVNGSYLTRLLSESAPHECFLVLFYVPWCPFSARLAPFYNALPKAFLNLDILAFDVSKSIGYNTKFGTSAVPIVLLFQQKNVLAKFNYTEKNLTDFIEFVSLKTGSNYFYLHHFNVSFNPLVNHNLF